jgi:ABC-type antimicrobial peptide transport system permease subunit
MASQRHVNVGGVQVGGGAPVVVQTMTKTETANLAATMDQIVAGQQARPRFNAVMLNWLSGLALLLAIVGIHGVVAYSAAQRTGELAIRMAVGASAKEVVRLVVADGMRPVLIGVGLGLGAALALARLIQNLLFGISATDPVTFIAVAGGLSAVALLACLVPAARASRLDPLVALRRD